jgi:hypothetical protein
MSASGPTLVRETEHSPADSEMLQGAERPTVGGTLSFQTLVSGTSIGEAHVYLSDTMAIGRGHGTQSVGPHVGAAYILLSASATGISPYSAPSVGRARMRDGAPAEVARKMSRLLFELKVLGVFLREVVGHPRSTSRFTVDPESRTIEVDRD